MFVVVRRRMLHPTILLDGDEDGGAGDELLVARAEDDFIQDPAQCLSVRSSGKRQSPLGRLLLG